VGIAVTGAVGNAGTTGVTGSGFAVGGSTAPASAAAELELVGPLGGDVSSSSVSESAGVESGSVGSSAASSAVGPSAVVEPSTEPPSDLAQLASKR
jgi:hypothetical protein